MAVVDSWSGADRHIHLAQGVTEFHPIDDIYREYRTYRRTVEGFRKWEPFMVAVGNEPKGGGKFTPRYLLLLAGAKIVPYDESGVIDVTGEVLTDDQTAPVFFDNLSPGTTILMNYTPPTAEVIQISSGSGLSPEQDATLTAAAADALLARKLLDADEILLPSGVWTLIDSDDGTTLLRTRNVQDHAGDAIELPAGAPARRTRI